ncbi:50s ribosomal protein l33 [Fusarium langsethiae]|uniref:Large ribosomal subunit protein bL33m n=4 Tax=Fusarium TaxID=5506 RepID=A0A0M9F5C9_FUSLA|nr:50s ribosomal protein l33 [Fusarium langsethiae]
MFSRVPTNVVGSVNFLCTLAASEVQEDQAIRSSSIIMAKKAKARLVHARLVSMAMTGFFYTFKRPRTAPMMSMLKYDPIVRKKVLFLESKKRK